MRLLFITQKLHGQDSFGILWVRAFIRSGFDVTVLTLEGSDQQLEFPVRSMGKEKKASKLSQILTFERIILTEKYDRVFIHMAPVWYVLGFWFWSIRRIPTYLWYTHYKMQLGVRLFGWFGTRFFCATSQSLPQYEGHLMKTVVGHGIDLSYWPKRENRATDPKKLLMVHRLSRSKRVELSLRALTLLDAAYTLDIYGIEAESDYVREMKTLTEHLGLASRVRFHGTVPMDTLPSIYSNHRLILNMASETIDKTMLEAMTCGCYPVTTAANAKAIGIQGAPHADTPEAVAEFVRAYASSLPISADAMYEVVQANHSLEGLVKKMGVFIHKGH